MSAGLIGSRLARRLVARFGRHKVMLTAGALRACWSLPLAFIRPGAAGIVLVVAAQLGLVTCVGVFNPVFATYRLDQTPADRVARTLSAWSVTSSATIAALTVLWGLLASITGPRTAIASAGLLILTTPLLLPRHDHGAPARAQNTQHRSDLLRYRPPCDEARRGAARSHSSPQHGDVLNATGSNHMAERARVGETPATASSIACPAHPDGRIREFLADGDEGRGLYRFCLPADGRMHALAFVPPEARSETPPEPRERPRRFERARPDAGAAPADLSEAELDVLRHAARGLTVPETARVLQKGAETVKSQRNRVILKLGARNMTHAVGIAVERGIASPG